MMKKRAALFLFVFLSACTLSKPPDYDLPSASGVFPGQEITVGSGENLYAVAQKNNVRLRELIVVNKLEPPYRVKPGQKLYLPSKDGYAPTPKAAPLEPIDKGNMGPSSPSIRPESVTATPLEAPAASAPPPVALSTPAEPAPAPAPSAARTTNIGTREKARAASEVPEIDIDNLRKSLLEEEEARKETAPAPQTQAAPPEQPAASGAFPSFAWPVRGTIVSAFGPKGKGRDNDGINIAAPKGSPVKAAARGVVAYAGSEMKGFGNLILIRHEGGWVTAYAHLARMVVAKDAPVEEGEMIGTVGTTGGVKSPQLHFEARREGKPVDPELVLK